MPWAWLGVERAWALLIEEPAWLVDLMGSRFLALDSSRPGSHQLYPSSRQTLICHFDILLPDEPVDQGHRQKTLSVLVSRAVTCKCGWLSGDGHFWLLFRPGECFLNGTDEKGLPEQADRVGRRSAPGRLHDGNAVECQR